jgi:putative transcriptional regulator
MTDDEKMTRDIASQLRKVRRAKDMTQVQVAQKAGIDENYYPKLERAESTPSLKTLRKITKALDAHSSDILPF